MRLGLYVSSNDLNLGYVKMSICMHLRRNIGTSIVDIYYYHNRVIKIQSLLMPSQSLVLIKRSKKPLPRIIILIVSVQSKPHACKGLGKIDFI